MTPLAQHWCRQKLERSRDRKVTDGGRILPFIESAQCFEVSQVKELWTDFAQGLNWVAKNALREYLFTPAPVSLIEFATDSGRRNGWILRDVETRHGAGKMIYGVNQTESKALLWIPEGPNGRFDFSNFWAYQPRPISSEERHTLEVHLRTVLAILALINTPQIVGRVTRLPHAGLQKRLRAAAGLGGTTFPLRAWTEIQLRIRDPEREESVREGWLTGGRALHFVRAHLRLYGGRLIYVRGHWRGDSSLGIRRSRYTATREAGDPLPRHIRSAGFGGSP